MAPIIHLPRSPVFALVLILSLPFLYIIQRISFIMKFEHGPLVELITIALLIDAFLPAEIAELLQPLRIDVIRLLRAKPETENTKKLIEYFDKPAPSEKETRQIMDLFMLYPELAE